MNDVASEGVVAEQDGDDTVALAAAPRPRAKMADAGMVNAVAPTGRAKTE